MIIDYDGQQYPFAMDDVTVKQAIAIEKYMGCPFAEWGKRLEAGGDLPSLQALGWLILRQGAADVLIEDTDFKIGRLGEALMKAAAAEAPAPAQEAEAVPTVAAGSNGHGAAAASSPVSLPPSSAEISR